MSVCDEASRSINWSINDGAVAPVVFTNPCRYVAGNCDEPIHPLRCRIVPIPYIVRDWSEGCSYQGRHRAKIGRVRIPDVTHRRITIANVHRMGLVITPFIGPLSE